MIRKTGALKIKLNQPGHIVFTLVINTLISFIFVSMYLIL